MSRHLTRKEIDDCLLGIATSEASAHVAGCAECGAAMAAMRQRLGEFRTAAVAWSEAAPRLAAFAPMAPAHRRWQRPAWVLAAAAMLFAIVLPFSTRRGHPLASRAGAAAQAQISRDNQLLARIDAEVGEMTPTPMQPLQVNP